MIDLIEEFCDFRGYTCERLDGRVSGNDRQKVIMMYIRSSEGAPSLSLLQSYFSLISFAPFHPSFLFSPCLFFPFHTSFLLPTTPSLILSPFHSIILIFHAPYPTTHTHTHTHTHPPLPLHYRQLTVTTKTQDHSYSCCPQEPVALASTSQQLTLLSSSTVIGILKTMFKYVIVLYYVTLNILKD